MRRERRGGRAYGQRYNVLSLGEKNYTFHPVVGSPVKPRQNRSAEAR